MFKKWNTTKTNNDCKEIKKINTNDSYLFIKTKAFINRKLDLSHPRDELIKLLEVIIELLNYPGNDYAWSSWENSESAVKEIKLLIKMANIKIIPVKAKISLLFAATGPIQEVSISSGWGDVFIKLAEKFDEIERSL